VSESGDRPPSGDDRERDARDGRSRAIRSATLAVLRIGASAALLWLVFRRLDGGAVLARLAELRLGWVALALLITVAQVALLAWRWQLTAARLGVDLAFGEAVREYYLGILVNQIVPGGVLGDVSRAWRHARSGAPSGPAIRAVILERASAQIVMTLTALACVAWLAASRGGASGAVAVAAAVALAVALVVVVALMAVVRTGPATQAPDTTLGRFVADARRALFARDAFAPQLLSALAVVASYVAVFIVAARAVGTTTPVVVWAALVPPVLMTMLVPVTVAGWGIREAAAAALWALVGRAPEEGAAVSVAYGLIVLASSAPGLVRLIAALAGGRGRTGRPPRA